MELQNCRVPNEVGGTIDLILGIRYNNIAPKVIHTLDSELMIYSINLETHDPSINAAIGGPHKSFSAIVNYNGGVSKVQHSLQILYVTLDNFKKYGPPSVPVFPSSVKDQLVRQYYYQAEFGPILENSGCFQTEFGPFCKRSEFDGIHSNGSLPNDIWDDSVPFPENMTEYRPFPENQTKSRPFSANWSDLASDHKNQVYYVGDEKVCSKSSSFELISELFDEEIPEKDDYEPHTLHTCCNVTEEESLRDLKFWYKQIEAGTSVDYRCPECRECLRCKNSDNTDKISLREEVEQKAIEDSVHFDRQNRKIMVNLPKRGSEEFFLSSNRDIALKVYRKICEKASKGEDIRQEINIAFEKLFKNGHAVYLSDLDRDTMDKFINKPIQHYLPWRLVWKTDSVTLSAGV